MYYAFRRWSATARYYVASPYSEGTPSLTVDAYGTTPYEALRTGSGPYLWCLESMGPERFHIINSFSTPLSLQDFMLCVLARASGASLLHYLREWLGLRGVYLTQVQLVIDDLTAHRLTNAYNLAYAARRATEYLQWLDYREPGGLAVAARYFNDRSLREAR
jgi:hypothetical protein